MFRSIGTLAVCAVIVAPRLARAEAELSNGFWQTKVNERGQSCDRREERREGARVLVACGAAGVWEIALEASGPRFVQSYDFGGDAIGFFTEPDGRLWVKIQVLEARPFLPGGPASADSRARFPEAVPARTPPSPAPAPAVSPSPPVAPSAPAAPRIGRVVRAEPPAVVISLGSADGLTLSDRVELLVDRAEADEVDGEFRRDVLAVGVVTHLTEHSARVLLGLNENVPIGAVAALSHAGVTASLAAPARAGALWDAELVLRPFVAMGEFGGGLLVTGSVGRRLAAPVHLQVVLDPIGIATAKDGIGVASGAFIASFDTRLFEMGFGLGAQTVNSTTFSLPPGSGLSLAQLIRLGAEDGLNVTARTSVVLFHRQFEFGGMVASLRIPLSYGYWLTLGGGGGDLGYGYGEIGLRALLSGNGGAGSKFLFASAGGAAVFRDDRGSECFGCTRSYGGPMAGIGGEWRF